MQRGRFIFAAALALATASAQAATIVDSDFTLTDPTRPPSGWQSNGTGGLGLNPSGPAPAIALELTHNQGSESGTAWTLTKGRVPSFTMWADVNINFTLEFPANCPADGFTMAFADVAPTAVGGGGGSLALYGAEEVIPRFIAFEVNTWREQALESFPDCANNQEIVTFAFANANADSGVTRGGGTPEAGGGKLAQKNPPAGLKIINGGWYRFQWNVDTDAGTMAAYATGLEDSNKSFQNVPLTDVKFGADAPKMNFTGRWGVTAATGGAVQGTRVARIRIDAPMVAAGAPPTAGN
jgi:hypothetical protein